MKDKLLVLQHISKTYYTKEKETLAIDDISMDIAYHSIIAIVGPSGCGKSTLLNIIGGLEKQTSGTIHSDNSTIKIGYMFQSDCLFPWLTILDNCLLGLKIRHELTEEKKNYVIHLLKNYGLQDFIDSYPNNLSGGMRQRVALIRTLAVNPDILLLDEPFSALDFDTRLLVADDVYKIIKQEGKTAIIITHDIEEAISIANTVIVLSKRPAVVKKVIDIHLSDSKSPIYNRTCDEFNDYYKMIWEIFDHEI